MTQYILLNDCKELPIKVKLHFPHYALRVQQANIAAVMLGLKIYSFYRPSLDS